MGASVRRASQNKMISGSHPSKSNTALLPWQPGSEENQTFHHVSALKVLKGAVSQPMRAQPRTESIRKHNKPAGWPELEGAWLAPGVWASVYSANWKGLCEPANQTQPGHAPPLGDPPPGKMEDRYQTSLQMCQNSKDTHTHTHSCPPSRECECLYID